MLVNTAQKFVWLSKINFRSFSIFTTICSGNTGNIEFYGVFFNSEDDEYWLHQPFKFYFSIRLQNTTPGLSKYL